jgi:uncharacterized protein (DUF1015 family)
MPQVAGFRGSHQQSGASPDPTRAVYRYHQIFAGPGRTLVRKNLLLAVRLAPWDEGTIRPHEATDPAEVAAELAAIRAAAAHREPFVAGFRDPPGEVERLLRKFEAGAPTLERTTTDGTQHRLWRIGDAELLGKLRHYFAPRPLRVLEGHARYEAMLAYRDELAAAQPLATYSSANYGLACLVTLDDPALVTAARHRVVRVEASRDPVLDAAGAHFIVERLPKAGSDVTQLHAALGETVAHQPAFVVRFPGEADAYKLTLSPDASPFDEGAAPHRALQKLDPYVVDHMFIARHLAGATITTEPDAARALAATDAITVIVRPLAIEKLAQVDELGQRLPAGSTALHPAVAGGLVSMSIDPDQDLV